MIPPNDVDASTIYDSPNRFGDIYEIHHRRNQAIIRLTYS